MFSKIWEKLSYVGTSRISNKSERRNIVISNRLVTGIFLLNIALYFAMISFDGSGPLATMMIVGNFVSYGLILSLTHLGYSVLARIILSLMVSVFTFSTTIISKMDTSHIWDDQYYSPRFYITMTAIVPILVFGSSNKLALAISLMGSFLTLLLFDPIHNYFGVGYFQSGHFSESYSFFTIITIAGYLVIVVSLLGYRRIIESYEKVQLESSKAMAEKNAIIEEQKDRLELSNDELNEELKDKNKELLKSLSELRQFSYTLSHNLRSPVASLLGLTNLLDIQDSNTDEETKNVLNLIKKSSKELDETISDLGNLLEIKDEIGQIKEPVNVIDEINKVLVILDGEIAKSKVEVSNNPSKIAPINSVPAYVHSILYNLISNALKFKIPGGKHFVKINLNQDENNIVISIEDNGIGMDLEKYGDQLFKMYKRLNVHTSGKGLGLYITYYQVEALGGSIEVSSSPGKGATFTVKLPNN